ncbi:NADP-dependent oxidoreductase domain-containing protein [Gautieria morchelliformis]|nr:NADP-dependent oxidoreductase domain-containing protein [Gautieria morchelliformis]
MYEGADERLGGSEPMTCAPNLEARKISERLPVVENHLPSAASAGGNDQQCEMAMREQVPEGDSTVCGIGYGLEVIVELVSEGKIKYIGLSECNADTLRRAKAVKGAGDKLIAVQMEFGPLSLDIEQGDFMKAVEETGVAVVAYSPLSRGLATARFKSRADFEEGDFRLYLPRFSEENFPKNLVVVEKLKEIGQKTGNLSSGQVALAWILAEYPNVIPIPGSRTVERLEENVAAGEVQLAPEDVKAIRKLAEEANGVGGPRYPPQYVSDGMCIPLNEWKGE